MEREFDPNSVIERLCTHHKVDPKRLLSAMLTALARFRLLGRQAFPDLIPSNPDAPADMHCEIQALMISQEPPLDPATYVLGSLLDAVVMCVNYDCWHNETLSDEMTNTKNSDTHEWMEGMMLGTRAREQSVLMLMLKECINQIDAMGLEMAIEGEKE